MLKVTLYQSNLGYSTGQTVKDNDGRWKGTFGNEEQFSTEMPFLGYGNQTWQQVSLTFVASVTSQRLEFQAVQESSSTLYWTYMGIGGVQIFRTSCVNNLGSNTTPNHLDLDSDDDRCPDTFKPSAILTYYNLVVKKKILKI